MPVYYDTFFTCLYKQALYLYLLEQNWQEIVAFGKVLFTFKEGESLGNLLPCKTCICDLAVLELHCGWHPGSDR